MVKRSLILLVSIIFISSCKTTSYHPWSENRVYLTEGFQKTTYLETLTVSGKKEYSLPELITFSKQKLGEGVTVQNVRKEMILKPFGLKNFHYTWDVVKIE